MNPLNLQQLSMLSFMRMPCRGAQGVFPSGAWSAFRPEQAAATDAQKRPLRFRFWARLSRSVRCCACSCIGRRVHWPAFYMSH
jgi:hypothetical protein